MRRADVCSAWSGCSLTSGHRLRAALQIVCKRNDPYRMGKAVDVADITLQKKKELQAQDPPLDSQCRHYGLCDWRMRVHWRDPTSHHFGAVHARNAVRALNKGPAPPPFLEVSQPEGHMRRAMLARLPGESRARRFRIAARCRWQHDRSHQGRRFQRNCSVLERRPAVGRHRSASNRRGEPSRFGFRCRKGVASDLWRVHEVLNDQPCSVPFGARTSLDRQASRW